VRGVNDRPLVAGDTGRSLALFSTHFFEAFDARPQLMKTKNNAAPTAISPTAVNKGVDRFGFDAVEMMLRRR
jgi:hypothetical protein